MENGNFDNFNKPGNYSNGNNDRNSNGSSYSYSDPGSPRRPERKKDNKKSKLLIILLVALIAVVLIVAAVFYFSHKSMPAVDQENGPEKRPEGVTEISLEVYPLEATDTVGNTITVTAVTFPDNSPVTWSSSDSDIAAVDENGVVTLKSDGKARIYCTLYDSLKTFSSITVLPRNVETPPETGEPAARNGGSSNAPANRPAGSGSIDWGNYSGPTEDGEPNGFGGTVTVSRQFDITLVNGETMTLLPGDKITNCNFRNGQLAGGTLNRHNREQGLDFICGVSK